MTAPELALGEVPGGLSRGRERMAKEALEAGASVAAAARRCGLSRSYFIQAFKASTGLTPHRWARERRLQAARTLLGETSETIAEIAQRCGFADQSHLTRAFRTRWGDSPARYRRRAKAQRPACADERRDCA